MKNPTICQISTPGRVAAPAARRPVSWLAATLLGLAMMSPASALDVWVDFISDFHDGDNNDPNGVADWIDELNDATSAAGEPTFSATERELIQSNILDDLGTVYAGYNINFLTSQPSGLHDVIYFGQVGTSFGSAQVDVGNLNTITYSDSFLNNPSGNPGSVPKVATGNFNSFIEPAFDTRDETIEELSTALAGTAAHELAHSLGICHHFAYSAEGITPDNLDDTGGLQNQHVIATGSTGLNEAEREGDVRTLSPYSRVILEIAGGATSQLSDSSRENTPVVDNPIFSDASELFGGDAGNTRATAQDLSFETGEVSGYEISFVEATIDGGSSDVDLFRFDTLIDTTFSSHVFSERLLFSNEFDPTLSLLDADGNLLAFSDDVDWGGDSIVLDEAESLSSSDTSFEDDPFLFNIELAAGTYYLEVAPATEEISDAASTGDEYWLVTSLIPDLSSVILGDYNADGFVSQADLDLILLNWGDDTLPEGFNKFAIPELNTFDDLISQNELDGVLLNWGSGTAPSFAVIPEPTVFALLSLGGLGTLARRRSA